MIQGNGTWHFRKFGLASHIGVEASKVQRYKKHQFILQQISLPSEWQKTCSGSATRLRKRIWIITYRSYRLQEAVKPCAAPATIFSMERYDFIDHSTYLLTCPLAGHENEIVQNAVFVCLDGPQSELENCRGAYKIFWR